MANKYMVKTNDKNCIEMTKPNSSIIVYKIPYKEMKNRVVDVNITNRFIVYILVGKNTDDKDIIYVGKSKNGIDNRPTAHEDENKKWKVCYVLTTFAERTFFNDGTIMYIEDQINQRLRTLDMYENTTKVTTSDTTNIFDKEFCDEYIEEVYKMLYILGLDLTLEEVEMEGPVLARTVPTGLEDMYNNLANVFRVPNEKDLEKEENTFGFRKPVNEDLSIESDLSAFRVPNEKDLGV
jgi:hypothetical protein